MIISYEAIKPQAEWIKHGDVLVVTEGIEKKPYMIVQDELTGKPGMLELSYYGGEWYNHPIHIRNHMNKKAIKNLFICSVLYLTNHIDFTGVQ